VTGALPGTPTLPGLPPAEAGHTALLTPGALRIIGAWLPWVFGMTLAVSLLAVLLLAFRSRQQGTLVHWLVTWAVALWIVTAVAALLPVL